MLLVVQLTKSPVVGAVANPRIVLLAVAALPHVVVKLPLAGNMDSVPAVPDLPSVGVYVSAGVAPARISPALPTTSRVVLLAVPPTASVLFGVVIVSPPPPVVLQEIVGPVEEYVQKSPFVRVPVAIVPSVPRVTHEPCDHPEVGVGKLRTCPPDGAVFGGCKP